MPLSVRPITDPTRPTEASVDVRHAKLGRSLTVGREIGRYGTVGSGPLLVVLAGVHGNEPAGLFAADEVLGLLRRDVPGAKGALVVLAGNLPALKRDVRYIHHDLNRIAHPNALRRLREAPQLADAEEHELLEVVAATDALAAEHAAAGGLKKDRFFIDVHTTSSESLPYVSVPDRKTSLTFAKRFPTYAVVGFERAIHGALLELFEGRGWSGYTFEAGQHHDLASVESAAALLWLALREAGVLDDAALPQDPHPDQILRRGVPEGRRWFDVIHRHAIGPGVGFKMRPGFVNFQPIEEGQPLADDRDGPIRAPATGRILMPLYQALGEDGFFLISERT